MISELLGGLFCGVFFGFLLRKAHVTKRSVILGQLLLKDFTVMKVMMSAIIVGGLLITLLMPILGVEEFVINSTTLLAAIIGGGVFGIGMALVGYCPGTCVAAIPEGRADLWFALFGMIAGGAIYAEVAPLIGSTIKPKEAITHIRIPELLNLSPWWFLLALAMPIFMMWLYDRRKKRSCCQ